jgi:hypothetical protein
MKLIKLETYRTRFTGQTVAECPDCHIVVAGWDDDDLDESGALYHHCDGGAE